MGDDRTRESYDDFFFLRREVTVFLKIIRINCKERRFQRRLKSAIAAGVGHGMRMIIR